MKNINKGLGYLATAAISITIIIVTKDTEAALLTAIIGFGYLSLCG